jgi:hypothetical protein
LISTGTSVVDAAPPLDDPPLDDPPLDDPPLDDPPLDDPPLDDPPSEELTVQATRVAAIDANTATK